MFVDLKKTLGYFFRKRAELTLLKGCRFFLEYHNKSVMSEDCTDILQMSGDMFCTLPKSSSENSSRNDEIILNCHRSYVPKQCGAPPPPPRGCGWGGDDDHVDRQHVHHCRAPMLALTFFIARSPTSPKPSQVRLQVARAPLYQNEI